EFWTDGYFVATVGEAGNWSVVERYVRTKVSLVRIYSSSSFSNTTRNTPRSWRGVVYFPTPGQPLPHGKSY
ncbi:MAG: hypothetical protein VB141_02620, partial [Burkholderia gladioli]